MVQISSFSFYISAVLKNNGERKQFSSNTVKLFYNFPKAPEDFVCFRHMFLQKKLLHRNDPAHLGVNDSYSK
jgi:hypothetical protein